MLVVIAIIAILAAITFGVVARAKDAGKKSVCLSNLKQTTMACMLYLEANDGGYPQTRKTSADPALDDASGALEEPDYDSAFNRLVNYTKTRDVFRCPADPDPAGRLCDASDPDHPMLDSFLINGYFSFGLRESSVSRPSDTILFAERRSTSAGIVGPFCIYLYRPWYSSLNPAAPEDDMDPVAGAMATGRHSDHSVYAFADSHVKVLAFRQTFDPLAQVNLHRP